MDYRTFVKQSFSKYKDAHPETKITKEVFKEIMKQTSKEWKKYKIPIIDMTINDEEEKKMFQGRGVEEMRRHNIYEAAKRNLEHAAKNYDYIKGAWVQRRGLAYTPSQIWNFVLSNLRDKLAYDRTRFTKATLEDNKYINRLIDYVNQEFVKEREFSGSPSEIKQIVYYQLQLK